MTFIKLVRLNFVQTKGNYWVETSAICKRDSLPIYRQYTNDGSPLNIFCCERQGCTWCDYDSGKSDIADQLNEPEIKKHHFTF